MKNIAWSRKWKVAVAVLIVAVAVPTGILGTFTLMNAESGTIMVESVSWQMYRPKLDPYDSFHINETVKNGYSDNCTSMEISVHVWDYVEDWSWFGKHKDGIVFRVNVTAMVAEGFNASFAVRFRTVDDFSTLYLSREFLVAYNVSVTEMRLISREWRDGGWHNLGEAYVKAESMGSRCTLEDQIEWVFTDLNVEDHELEAVLEFTYFNQTTSQEINVPIILDMPLSTQNGG